MFLHLASTEYLLNKCQAVYWEPENQKSISDTLIYKGPTNTEVEGESISGNL